MTRVCKMCKREFDLNATFFYKKKNGFQNYCKECHRLDSRRSRYDKIHGEGSYYLFYVNKIEQRDLVNSGKRICNTCSACLDVADFYPTHARCKDCYSRQKQINKYGISSEGSCEICGDPADHVDHDHDSGFVRGRLCSHCNLGLGHFRDDPERLRSAAIYLDEKMALLECAR